MSPIRTLLGYNENEPICHSCSKAYGLVPLDKAVTFAMQTCCVCRSDQPCCAIRDFAMPANIARRADFRAAGGETRSARAQTSPDDYSELEALLGGPRT